MSPAILVVHSRDKAGRSLPARVWKPALWYQEWHYRGWEECLYQAIANGGDPPADGDLLVLQSNEPYRMNGYQAGYNECRDEIKKMHANGDSDAEVVRRCRAAFLKISIRPLP